MPAKDMSASFERYPRSDELPGKILGPYKIDTQQQHHHLTPDRFNYNSQLYPATNISTQQRVMIKFDTSVAAFSPATYGENLKIEHAVLARANHPNIPHVYELIEGPIFDTDQRNYCGLAMQLIDGTSLEEIMDLCDESTTSPNLPHIFEKLGGIADALSYAHTQLGVVYEDLKPGNILIETSTQSPYLIDWETVEQIGKAPTSVTGTLRYFSPEKAKEFFESRLQIGRTGKEYFPTPAGDVFSLGVLCYELLSGEWPFDQRGYQYRDMDTFTILDQIKNEPHIPLSNLQNLRSQLSAEALLELDNIFVHALDKNPSTRLNDPRQLVSSILETITKHNIHFLNYSK